MNVLQKIFEIERLIRELKADLAEEAIARIPGGHFTLQSIVGIVCEHRGVDRRTLMVYSGTRTHLSIAYTRWLIWLIGKELLPELSLPDLARAVGCKKHGSALYGLRKINSEMEAYPNLRIEYEFLLAKCRDQQKSNQQELFTKAA